MRSLLEVMVEPLSRSLASAPVEEEDVTSDTAAALDRARSSLERGEGIPHEDGFRLRCGDYRVFGSNLQRV